MVEARHNSEREGEQGFMLLAMVVAIFLVLLALGVAAPRVAQDLRRERELEAIQRGNQYVRAIRLYYLKFGRYPASMDALTKSNNIRFLRQQYVNPLTGKADWKLIHVGQAKTTVKGFFGQPLAGLPGAAGGLGSVSSQVSNLGGSNAAGGSASPGSAGGGSGLSFGSSSSSGPGYGAGASASGPGFGSSSSPGGTAAGGAGGGAGPGGLGAPGAPGAAAGSDSAGSMGGISSQSASTFSGGGAPFVGIGIPKSGDSITVLNEQTSYQTWEFIYDPRIEQLAQKAALMGGGSANSGGSIGGGGFGSQPSGFGSQPSGFGSQPGSSGPGSTPFGSSPSNPSSPTTPGGGTTPGSPTPQ